MESSSASEGASPDVRPVICESLLDLSDWGDLLGICEKHAEQAVPEGIDVEQSSKASSAEEHSDSCARSSPSVEIQGQGTINLPIKTQQTDSGVIPSVLQTNGTAVRARKRIRHSWPDVSVKLGQDVTYNCFPHEHFSFAFKEVLFREEKIQEEDDDDDLPDISLVASPEPTFPTKREKSSHNKLSKTVKILHSRKTDKKASVLTEQQGKNTLVSPHSHGEDRRDKLKEGRSSPLITLGVSALKKPGVIKERNVVPIVLSGAHSASSQTPIAGPRGPTVRAPVTILQPGVQTPSTKGSPQQSSGVSNVVQISNTSQDGRSTPTHSSLVTVLPPTPPNEPVVVQPMPQVLSQAVPKVVPKVSPAQLTAQHMQVVLKHVKAQPSKPQGVSPFSSPTIQVMKVSQVLTPPIDKRVATISSPPAKQEQLLLKQKEPPADIPLEKPQERPSVASAEKDTTSTVSSMEGSTNVTGKPLADVAMDNTLKVGEDEEEVDVVETMKPSEDETDSQVEVTESKVEMRDDTKEVLSSLKRKSPSSPCSTLLKIKCEKIDAVVRINKTNEDLYRAEGSQEKRSVQVRRNSRSAAEQGCFFNVVDKSSRLGVCPCGRANSYDAMIACDNPQCEVEWYHFTCVGVTKVPKDEWFCPFCSKETAEALRRKKERRKELRRKKKAEEDRKRKRVKRVPQEEAGLCPCGQPNSWDRMIACDGRDCSVEWYHFRCVDVKSAPDEEWLCILCRDTVQEPRSSPYARRKRRYLPIKYTIYGDSGDGSTDDTKEEKEWKEDQSSDDSSDSKDTSDDEEDAGRGKGDDGRSRVRERARSKWREALSEEVDVDGDSNQSSSDDDDDELSRSKRSRRMRHKKIDLDFEDGAEFDEDMGGRGDEITRTKITPKRIRTSSGEKRSLTSSTKTNEPSDKEKDAYKMLSSGSSDQGTEALSKQKIVSAGRFLIQECSLCGQEFVIPPTEDSNLSNQDNPAASVLCHMCVTKSKEKGEKSASDASLLPQTKTKDTTDPSPSSGGGDALSTTDSSESGVGKKDGEAQGSRSTRFHEIVACKVCGMGYRTRVSLLIHMKDKHQGHLGCFECAPCDRLFISQEECGQHMASLHHV